MIHIENKANCCGCTACAVACPVKCISMQSDKKGFSYPIVDTDACINCHKCELICPIINNSEQSHSPLKTLAANAKDHRERSKSTSGGVCHLLAVKTIEKGGVVIGAELQSDLSVKHIIVKDISNLERIRNSKYLQSLISSVLKPCKKYLAEGRKVLFIGTPCQVSALLNFLGKNYDNLTCIDFVCHGVPSRIAFNKYIEAINPDRKHIKSVNFRLKDPNWRGYSTSIYYENGDNIVDSHSKSLFFRGFMSNLYLRDCCYECKFNNNKTSSDITVGDLWGVEHITPEIDDNTGLSLLLIRTPKGKEVVESISNMINNYEYKYSDALKYNPAIEMAPKHHKMESFFWLMSNILPFRINSFICLLLGRIMRKLKF